MLIEPASLPQRADPSLFLGELAHRVCNEYAAVISRIELAAARATNNEAKVTLEQTAERLNEFANVHRALRVPAEDCAELSDYLENLCRALSRSRLLDQGIELALVEERVVLSSERCWHVGLIVSELVTNAAKHAFEERGGRIRVEIRVERDRVLCCVMDDGTWKHRRPGRGTRIVDVLAARMGGKLLRDFGPCGTAVTLIFPREPQQQLACSRSSPNRVESC
jgi:two-component sensor histidine kinase